MSNSIKGAEKAPPARKSLTAPGSIPGIFSLVLSLACAVGYGVTQMPSRDGYAGQVERQWREEGLGLRGPGLTLLASGDIQGRTVTDPAFRLTVNGIHLSRRVKIYQWMESCGAQGCQVKQGWAPGWVDASKFKTPGYSNPKPSLPPEQLSSLTLATRAVVGKGSITAAAASQLAPLAKPYKMGPDDVDLPGWEKTADGYRNYSGEPRLGSAQASFKTISNGLELTVAGYPDARGDIDAPRGSSDLLFKEGAMGADELLGLAWWELPRFGWALLGLSFALFVAGAFGLWTARDIERQIVQERRRRDADRRSRSAQARGASSKGAQVKGGERRGQQRRAPGAPGKKQGGK